MTIVFQRKKIKDSVAVGLKCGWWIVRWNQVLVGELKGIVDQCS
jgi:hypothetical protein